MEDALEYLLIAGEACMGVVSVSLTACEETMANL